jgi:hypothetical protein
MLYSLTRTRHVFRYRLFPIAIASIIGGMPSQDVFTPETIAAAIGGLPTHGNKDEIAEAGHRLLCIYREIPPLARRLLALPNVWSPAHGEVLFLFRHLADSLGALRPEAQTLLAAFGEAPSATGMPEDLRPDLLASMIQQLDHLEPVAKLAEADRSLLPLHLAEIAAYAEEIARLEAHLAQDTDRYAFLPALLWRAGAALEFDLARSHIFDRSDGERGLLTILGRIL